MGKYYKIKLLYILFALLLNKQILFKLIEKI